VHELMHVRRRDPWVRAAQILLQTLYFFHPLVWWINRQIHRERELCCDDAVVHYYRGARRRYVETLLNCASSSHLRSPLHSIIVPTLGVAGAASNVHRRIRRMLSQNYRVPTTTPQWRIALMVSVIVAAMVLAGAASPEVEGPRGPNPGRLSAIQTVAAYCTTNENGEINWDQKFDSSGDLEIGTRLAGPDFFTARDGESLARAIQMLLDKPVVDETLNEPHEAFTVRTHRSAEGTVFLESVLRNIEVQSDLQLNVERRPIDVARLFLTE